MGAQFGFSGCEVPAFASRFSTTFHKIVVDVITSGQSQACGLFLGVSMGMFPVKHPAPSNLMAVNYCERQLAQRLG